MHDVLHVGSSDVLHLATDVTALRFYAHGLQTFLSKVATPLTLTIYALYARAYLKTLRLKNKMKQNKIKKGIIKKKKL